MAKKISELALPTLPLAGTELIEMSQSSISVKVTLDELQSDVLGGIGSFDGTTFTVIGDIVCNDITTAGDTIYLGETTIKSLNKNEVQIGQPEINFSEAKLHLRGDDSDRGGRIYLYVGAAENSTITYYTIQQDGQNLEIGPNTFSNALTYDGSLREWMFRDVSGGPQATFGVEGVSNGEGNIALYGDDSIAGGKITWYVAPSYDATIDYFRIYLSEDRMLIGPNTDPDSLYYDGPAQDSWNIRGGNFRVGIDNNTHGQIRAYGDAASVGGEMRVYNGAAYDTTIDYYVLAAGNGDSDLTLGPATNANALQYNATNSSWVMAASGGVYVGNQTTGSGSHLHIGINDHTGSDYGEASLYAGSTVDGGTIKLYTGTAYDTTIDFYYMRAFEDDLAIGPSNDWDALKYDGGLQQWQMTGAENGSQLAIGAQDQAAGEGGIILYGDDSDRGGIVKFHTPSPYDSTISMYQIRAQEDDFELGPNTDPDSLKLDGATGQWQFTNLAGAYFAGDITCGIDDTNPGILTLYGDSEDVGGRLVLYNAADADGTAEYWQISSEENDSGNSELIIQTNAGLDFLNFQDSLSTLELGQNIVFDTNISGAVVKLGVWQVAGFNVDASAAELNTKEFTVFLSDISGANEISFVSPVNGTVTQVYSSVTGDPGADATISGQVSDGTSWNETMVISNGSAQHDVDSMTPASFNTVAPGDTVRFISDGGASNAVGIWLTVVITL